MTTSTTSEEIAETVAALVVLQENELFDAMDRRLGQFATFLTSTNLSVLNNALMCLLLYCVNDRNRGEVFHRGVLPHVINLVMLTQTDATVVRKALSVLRFCSYNRDCRDLFATREMMLRVFGLLDLKHTRFAEIILAFIWNTSIASARIRQVIMDIGLVPLIISVFTDRVQATVNMKRFCFGIICNLVSVEAIKVKIEADHKFSKILETELIACDTLGLRHSGLLCPVVKGIFAFSTLDPLKLWFAESRVLPRLIHHLTSNNTIVVSSALGALANIAICPATKPLFLRFNIQRIIVALSDSSDVEIRAQLGRWCLALTVLHANRLALCRNTRVCEAFMTMLRSENPRVYFFACATIANVIVVDEFKPWFVTAGLAERLCQLLPGTDGKIRETILRCMFTCSVNRRAKGLIMGYPNFHVHLFPSLCSRNGVIRLNAAGVLGNLCAHTNQRKQKLFELGITQVLIKCIQAKDFVIDEQFARLLFSLSKYLPIRETIVNANAVSTIVLLIKPDETEANIQRINSHLAGSLANLAENHAKAVLDSGAVPVMIKLACSQCDRTDARKAAIVFVDNILKNTGCVTVPGRVVDWESEYKRNGPTAMQKRFVTLFYQVLKANDSSELFDITMAKSSSKQTRGNKRAGDVDLLTCGRFMKSRSSIEHDLTLVLPIRVENEVKYTGFNCHKLIVLARWKHLRTLALQNATVEDNGNTVVVLPREWASTWDSWTRFLFYLYTDGCSGKREIKKKTVNPSTLVEVAHLAIKTKVQSMHYLLEISCGQVKHYDDEQIRKYYESIVSRKPSTWVEDMQFLLNGAYPGSEDMVLIPDINDCQGETQSFVEACDKRVKLDTEYKQCGTQQVKINAHQLILKTCSDYFKIMLGSTRWKDSKKTVLHLEGSTRAVRVLLTYYYCGYTSEIDSIITTDLSFLVEVLSVANRYNCHTLVAICEKKMIESPDFNESCFYVMLQHPVITRTPVLFVACVYNFYQAVKSHEMSVQENLHRLKALAGIEAGEFDAYDAYEPDLVSEIQSVIEKWSS